MMELNSLVRSPEASVISSSIARYALEKYVSDYIAKRDGTKIFIEVSTADTTDEDIKNIYNLISKTLDDAKENYSQSVYCMVGEIFEPIMMRMENIMKPKKPEVKSRFLYGKEFEYRPEFKLWINTNYKPQISGNDDGIWSRVKLIPFSVYIPPEKRDPHLKDYLREREIDKILNWALEGLKLWQKEGLEMPEEMKVATMDYRSEMDVMQKFLNDCTKPNSKCNVGASALYKVYSNWCAENGEYTLSKEIVKQGAD